MKTAEAVRAANCIRDAFYAKDLDRGYGQNAPQLLLSNSELATIIERETHAPEALELLRLFIANPIVDGMSARIRDHAQQNGIRDPFAETKVLLSRIGGQP